MIKSMTAYASIEKSDGKGITVSIEIRTYNSRNLDLVMRLPTGFAAFEENIKHVFSPLLSRGRVELRLALKDTSENALFYEVDEVKLKSYLACVEDLKHMSGLSSQPSLDFFAGLPGIIIPRDMGAAVALYWPMISECLQAALNQIDQMRSKEGAYIGRDIVQRLNDIEGRLTQIETGSEDLPAIYRDKLLSRITSLTNGAVALDPVRIAQEAAFLADRSDISEEIIRVRSHIAQFRSIMADAEPSGRRLNFLLQEFNREFNTMGSKIGQAQIAHVIVDIKAEIEKMREQVQNIE